VNFVVTAKARSRDPPVPEEPASATRREELGRRLLDQALADSAPPAPSWQGAGASALLDELGSTMRHELYEQLGLGERLAPLVARMPAAGSSGRAAMRRTPAARPDAAARLPPLAIAGTEGMVVSYARCCHPIPGDEIMGFCPAGRGVVIHRTSCGNLAEYRKQPNKWIRQLEARRQGRVSDRDQGRTVATGSARADRRGGGSCCRSATGAPACATSRSRLGGRHGRRRVHAGVRNQGAQTARSSRSR
jgi:(p)ppGpp synthase/HD superfamily hydrolase